MINIRFGRSENRNKEIAAAGKPEAELRRASDQCPMTMDH
jgi:hypothetical protein